MDYRHYLPSKQFVFLLGSLLIAGLLIYGAALLGGGKKLSSSISLSPANNQDVELADSDGDGLPDWEEAVRGTDPHKADSDGDNTSDGAEVKTGRNPMKPGPDDFLTSAANAKFIEDFTAAASSSNVTDTVSRSLFAQYVGARGLGTSGDVDTQQKLVDDAIAKANIGLKGRTYTRGDLTIVGDDANTTRTFANESTRAGHRHPTASFKNAVGALTVALDQGDPTAVPRLKSIGGEYRALARDLSEVPVPNSMADAYLKGINAFENAGSAFEDIAYVNEDPVRSVAGLKNYNTMTNVAGQAFVEVGKAIATKKINFAQGEPGGEWYVFLAGIAGSSSM